MDSYFDYMIYNSKSIFNLKIISEDLKNIFCKYDKDNQIEYILVKVYSSSESYPYYIMHFVCDRDVIDENNTCIIGDIITRLSVEYEKVKNLYIFYCKDYICDFVISDAVKKDIRKARLHKCMDFGPVFCFDAPGEGEDGIDKGNYDRKTGKIKLIKPKKSRKKMNKYLEKEFD